MDPKRRTLVPADLVGENKDLQSMPCLILSLIFLFEYGGLVLDLSLLALWSLSALVLSRIHPDTIFKKKVLTTTQTLEFLASIAAISGLRSKSYHAELNKQINNASLGPICPTYLKLPHGFNGCLRQMYLISHKACIKMSNAHNER